MQRNHDTFITLIGNPKLKKIDDGDYAVVCNFEVERKMGGDQRNSVTKHWVVVPLQSGIVYKLREEDDYSDSDIGKITFCEARKYLKTKLIDDTLLEEGDEKLKMLLTVKDLKHLKKYDPPNISLSSTFPMNLENERERRRLEQKEDRPFGFQQ